MGIELYLPQEFYAHSAPSAAKVVSGKVDEHYVLGVFFLVGEQRVGELVVTCVIAGAAECPGYRIDVGIPIFYSQVSLGGLAEYAEVAEIEIEQVRGGVDASQGAVHIEVISPELLGETS